MTNANSHDLGFLSGGAEVGDLTRNHDWWATPLGSPDTWPQPLKTLVSVILGSNQPMFVAWGPERTLLYNDAYAQILAAKHPAALGRDFLAVWHEIQADLAPIVARAYGGEPVHMDDIELLMHRNGFPEETHFAFSYTPVRDEAGMVAGFFCPCMEITGQVLAERRRSADTLRQRRLFEQAPGFITIVTGPQHVFEFTNAAYRQLFGHREYVGRTAREVFPELVNQAFFELLDDVYATGQRFVANHVSIRLARAEGATEERFLDFIYEPITDETGRITGIFVEGHDVTDAHRAEAELRENEARLAFLDRLGSATAPLADADAVLAATTRLLGEHLRVSVCAYADMDEDEDGFTIRGDWSAPGSISIVGHYRLADFGRLAVANLSAGQPLVVNDNLTELAPEEAATFQSIGIAATICMPLVKDGRLRALMAIHHKVPHAWTQDELALLREVTERSWAHVERVGSEALLRESNARFEAAVRAVEGVVWTTDADGRMTGEQAGWAALTGQSREQYEGFGWAAVVHPDDAEATLRAWQAAVAERKPFVFEHRLRRGDGVRRTFAVRAIPTFASDDAVLEWVGVHTDVTVHRQTEGQLRELNSTLEQRVSQALAERRILAEIVETTKAHIQVVDTNYRWLAVNRSCAGAYARIYGKRPVVGECLLDLLADRPEELQAAKAVWDRALSGVSFTLTAEFGDPARDRRHYEMTFEALRDGAGVQIGSFMTGIDITERVREQARLAEAEEALRQSQKMDAMGQLTGGVAHDFNNLLMPIIGGLDMLQRKGVGDPRSQRMVDGALQSAERAKTLVQRLLAFARRQPLQPQAVDVGSLIHGMVDLLASTVGPRIELALNVASDLPRAVADANQLEMALLNLAVNARDAMPEGGKLTIALGAESLEHSHGLRLPPGAYLRLCVHDTGVGMDEVTRLKATEPFFSTKGIGRGTGLGLSMVHGLAAQLGGALSIESAPGEGTTIKIWLPLALDDAVATIPSTDPAASPRSGTVLLVDDEALVRSSTSEMLGDLGFRVIEAESGEEALRRLEEEISVDVLITDHLMPGMTGIQLIGAARHRRAGLPVLLISGYADVEGIAPEFDRLTKPFRQSELAAVVAKLLPSG